MIGIFDSGIGGLTTLDEIKKLIPNENYIYVKDSSHNPYGSKTIEELNNITSNICDYLIKRGCKIIVIACNTATTRCITYLRNKYPDISFVGTEPAVKVSADKGFKNTLILATPVTIKSPRLLELINKHQRKDQNIYLEACDKLANAIELHNEKLINEIINNLKIKYKDKNIDSIVLGCTHYVHIKDLIGSYFPNVSLLDGNKGVSKRVLSELTRLNLKEVENPSVEIVDTIE